MTRIQVKPEPLDRLKTEATALFLFEDAKKEKVRDSVDKKLGGRISSLIRKKRYSPKKFSTRSIDTLGKMKSETVLLVGLGKKGDLTPDLTGSRLVISATDDSAVNKEVSALAKAAS